MTIFTSTTELNFFSGFYLIRHSSKVVSKNFWPSNCFAQMPLTFCSALFFCDMRCEYLSQSNKNFAGL